MILGRVDFLKSNSLNNQFLSIKSILGFIVSFICLYFVYLNFDFFIFLDQLKSLNYTYLLLSLFTIFLSLIVRAVRWKNIFNSNDISTYDLYRAELLGFWGNSVLPLKMGELMKIHYAKILTGRKYFTVLGTIIVERLIDFFLISPFLLLLYFYFPHEFISDKINMLIFILFIFALIFLMYKFFIIRIKQKITKSIDSSLLKNFSTNKNIILSSTVILWFLIYLDVYFVQASMTELKLTFFECFSIMLIGTIVYIIPSSPGTFGTFHLIIQEFMINVLDKPEMVSKTFAFILHAHSYIFFIMIGSYYFIKDSTNILSFRRSE